MQGRVQLVQACRFTVQGQQIQPAARSLQQVRGLASRSRAGVQHAHSRARIEDRCRQLGRRVLHTDQPLRKTGQVLGAHGSLQNQSRWQPGQGAGLEPGLAQAPAIGIPVCACEIDAQRHGRPLEPCLADPHPLRWPCGSQVLHQPQRVRRAGLQIGFQPRKEPLALA